MSRKGALRDPANRMYDEACSLLAAADALREAAEDPQSGLALVPALGCIEASLVALVAAVSHMHFAALARYDEHDHEPAKRLHESAEISASFVSLSRDLATSRADCRTARELSGRLLA